MRDEADFSAYAVARWPSLVRALVLLGVPPAEAPARAHGTLGRLRTDWRHRDELGVLDEHTARTLVEDLPHGGGMSDEWQALVLWSLLGVGAPAAPTDEEDVRRQAEAIVVPPLDLEQVVLAERERRRARRRRTTRVVAVVVALLAGVAGGSAWWATRSGPPPSLPDAPVERVDNPAPVGWYAEGTLQLDAVALTIDDLRDFAQVRQGAVYADSTGEIVLVEADGWRTRLGTQAPDGAFAASEQDGLAAWVDVGGAPTLHVYDLAEREEVAMLEVDASMRVLAVDGGLVYLVGNDGAYAFEWEPGWRALARVSPQGLLDVAGEARVYQRDRASILMTHQGVAATVSAAGVGAQLAPEGDYVLTRVPSVGSRLGGVRLYDTRSGAELDTGLPADAEVVAAKLGGRGMATYLVLLDPDDRSESAVSSLELTTCPVLDEELFTTCTVLRTFPGSATWALAQ